MKKITGFLTVEGFAWLIVVSHMESQKRKEKKRMLEGDASKFSKKSREFFWWISVPHSAPVRLDSVKCVLMSYIAPLREDSPFGFTF